MGVPTYSKPCSLSTSLWANRGCHQQSLKDGPLTSQIHMCASPEGIPGQCVLREQGLQYSVKAAMTQCVTIELDCLDRYMVSHVYTHDAIVVLLKSGCFHRLLSNPMACVGCRGSLSGLHCLYMQRMPHAHCSNDAQHAIARSHPYLSISKQHLSLRLCLTRWKRCC